MNRFPAPDQEALYNGVLDVKPLLPELEQAFLVFYPELQDFCRQYAARHKE